MGPHLGWLAQRSSRSSEKSRPRHRYPQPDARAISYNLFNVVFRLSCATNSDEDNYAHQPRQF